MKLKLTDDQRVAKHHFYSLGTDQEGRETLVGLTHEESVWYHDMLLGGLTRS
jgi:hypothetical protein